MNAYDLRKAIYKTISGTLDQDNVTVNDNIVLAIFNESVPFAVNVYIDVLNKGEEINNQKQIILTNVTETNVMTAYTNGFKQDDFFNLYAYKQTNNIKLLFKSNLVKDNTQFYKFHIDFMEGYFVNFFEVEHGTLNDDNKILSINGEEYNKNFTFTTPTKFNSLTVTRDFQVGDDLIKTTTILDKPVVLINKISIKENEIDLGVNGRITNVNEFESNKIKTKDLMGLQKNDFSDVEEQYIITGMRKHNGEIELGTSIQPNTIVRKQDMELKDLRPYLSTTEGVVEAHKRIFQNKPGHIQFALINNQIKELIKEYMYEHVMYINIDDR